MNKTKTNLKSYLLNINMSESKENLMKAVFVGTVSGIAFYFSRSEESNSGSSYFRVLATTAVGMFAVNNGREYLGYLKNDDSE